MRLLKLLLASLAAFLNSIIVQQAFSDEPEIVAEIMVVFKKNKQPVRGALVTVYPTSPGSGSKPPVYKAATDFSGIREIPAGVLDPKVEYFFRAAAAGHYIPRHVRRKPIGKIKLELIETYAPQPRRK